jgi:outer membrane protein assembly factor BamB
MRGTRFAVFGALLVLAPGAPGPDDDEDVPKRQPALAWEREVACDTAEELAAGTGAAPRRCNLAVAGDALYVLEHTAPDAPDGQFRLSRLDIDTGEELWSREVGPSAFVDAYAEAVVVSDKSRFEVYDGATGALRFERDGSVTDVNRYGTLLLTDGSVVTALDPETGDVLWEADGALGAFCRDIVIVVAPNGDDTGATPFVVFDHRTGAERWTSPEPFDPREDEITCGFGPFVYSTDGDELHEWDALSGWLNWSVAIAEAGDIEIYREVALVRSGADAETIVAVERETGEVLWERPTAEVGTAVSVIGRVREDSSGVFTLHPLTGDIVNHTSLTPGTSFEIVASSDTRVVVAAGSLVTAYGMNDLGTSWQLDVSGAPDEFAVSAGHLVVRTGPELRGYR